MPRKARRRRTCNASSDNWRASGNSIDIDALHFWDLVPYGLLSILHARVILCDASDEAAPRLGQPIPGGAVLAGRPRRLLQLWSGYWNRLEVRTDRKSTRLNSSHIPLSRMP